jgi:hypothetical protein
MPVVIGVFIMHGRVKAPSDKALDRFNRSYEYDGLGDQYARFLLDEILPEVETLKTSDGRPIRLSTVDPGLVETNFSRVRFRGDQEKARAVYERVEPLRPGDVAECIVFVLTRPEHVNIDELVIKARSQSSPVRIVRD